MISEPKAKMEIGYAGKNTRDGYIRSDEFLRELKGKKAIKAFREMRDNDSTIGAIMYAIEQTLRDVKWEVQPADESESAKREAEFIKEVLNDMEHSFDDHISEALSFLGFGFACFEVVYKRRNGPLSDNPKKKSKYSDGRVGIRKLASRAQWTIEKFDIDWKTGEFLGLVQESSYSAGVKNYIPYNKLIHYRTTNTNNDPSGRSVLRNCYKDYTFLSNLQNIEAIAVERELNGLPVARIPSEYLSEDATADQVNVRNTLINVVRDVKNNEQGFIVLPSDLITDSEGKKYEQRLIDLELISSNGTRNIDIDPIIKRYQHSIARSVLAEFLMLGSSNTGSYALSKSKSDIFLRSLEAYVNSIFDCLNMQLIEPLWKLNGLNYDLMPKLVPGDVAPHDLHELGSYLRNLNGANINLSTQKDIVNALLENAELPLLDEEVYDEFVENQQAMDRARADYYDDDTIPGAQGQPNQQVQTGEES